MQVKDKDAKAKQLLDPSVLPLVSQLISYLYTYANFKSFSIKWIDDFTWTSLVDGVDQ